MADGRRYSAFISYSHSDEEAARWLHRRVERYRIPRSLVGRSGEFPARRLRPVFRDREEFAAGGELKSEIEDALSRSDALIVLCSPRAAASAYVQSEVAYFQSLERCAPIIPVILEGEPYESFPPTLRDGRDRLGADFRRGKDERDGGSLKVLAGLLGVGLDTLVQRERAAQRWRMRAAASLALLFAGLSVAAVAFGIRSEIERVKSEANRLASEARAASEQDQALLLAAAAWRTSQTAPARAALFSTLGRNPRLTGIGRIEGGVHEPFILHDGRIVFRASGHEERVLTVDPGASVAAARPVLGIEGGVVDLAVIDEGRRIAVLREGEVAVYELQPDGVAAEKARHEIEGESFIAGAADGKALAMVTAPRTFELFDGDGVRMVGETLPFDLGDSNRLQMSADGAAVAVRSGNSLWLRADGSWRRLMAPPEPPLRMVGVRFDEAGERLVAAIGLDEDWSGPEQTAERMSRLACWSARTGATAACPKVGVIAFPGLLGPVMRDLVLNGHRDLGSVAQIAEAWVRSGNEWKSTVLRADPTFLTALAADASGTRLLVGTIDGELLSYSLAKLGPGETRPLAGSPQLVVWDAEGCRTVALRESRLASEACEGGDVREAVLGENVRVEELQAGSGLLSVIRADGSVEIMDAQLKVVATAPPSPDDAARYAAATVYDAKTGGIYVAHISDGRVFRYDAGQGWRLFTGADDPVRALALGRDGVILLGFENRGAVRAVEAATGRTIYETPLPNGQNMGSITPSPDGRHLYVTAMTNRHSLFKLDAATGKLEGGDFNRFSGPAGVIAMSADGRYLALTGVGIPDGQSAGLDSDAYLSVELWDAQALAPIGGFRTRAGTWLGALSPDGAQLALAADRPEDISIISLDPENWVRAACAKASRTLTEDERRRFNIPASKDACR